MKLKPLGELFSESFKAYRAALGHLIALETLPLLVFAAVAAVVVLAFFTGIVPFAMLMALIGIIACVVLSVSANIAMMMRIATERPRLELRASLSATRPYLLQYFWVSLLVGITVLLGFIAFIIPGIILGVWFSFSLMTLVFEDKKGSEALTASKRLVKGLWWPVFGRFVALMIAFLGITIPAGFVFDVVLGESLTDIAGTILNLIISPYITVYTYHLYMDLKRIKNTPVIDAAPVAQAM